jgi:uncharacterized membrane protein YfhO
MHPSEILSLQVNYDPGWEARAAGRRVHINSDGLGFIQIDPDCSNCSIDLTFNGGVERTIALAVSFSVLSCLLAISLFRTHH